MYHDFLNELSPQVPRGDVALKQNDLECTHGIIAEWCHDCKHLSKGSVKQVLLNENLAIVENLLSWGIQSKGNRTT